MQQSVKRLLCGAALLACSTAAMAQSDSGTQYGRIGGMNAANAQACGATPAQVTKLRQEQKDKTRLVFGQQPGYDAAYDTAAKATEQKVIQAWKQGQYKPQPEVCTELMRQVGS